MNVGITFSFLVHKTVLGNGNMLVNTNYIWQL